tara:strand:+ start:121 stop:288 length:168 start_codon:yes stop_codon:yes gene_type:complete
MSLNNLIGSILVAIKYPNIVLPKKAIECETVVDRSLDHVAEARQSSAKIIKPELR